MRIGGDLEVGRVGFGAMRLTGPNLWGDYPDRDGGIALLRQAVEAGVALRENLDAQDIQLSPADLESINVVEPAA
jgi:pyridoxine 4-dehydrogenase